MSRDDNIAALTQVGPIAQTQNWDRLGEVFASDVVDHDPAEGQPPGLEGIKWYWRNFTAAFPDLRFEAMAACADDAYVTLVAQMSGTHTGEWRGHAATGRSFSVRMIQTTRFANGLATERWIVVDLLGLLRQLGLGRAAGP
jgi:predicted ester cyclase